MGKYDNLKKADNYKIEDNFNIDGMHRVLDIFSFIAFFILYQIFN